MLIKIDAADGRLLHSQIASAIRRALEEGGVAVGEKLPAARTLAEQLQVNMHTVLKAYDELRDEGLIQMRRGVGTVVLEKPKARAKLRRLANELVREAKKLGLSSKEMSDLLEDVQ